MYILPRVRGFVSPVRVRAVVLCVISCLALSMASCSSSLPGGKGSDKAPGRVVISLSGGLQAVHAPYFHAAANGSFEAIEEEFGTKLSFLNSADGQVAAAALSGGSANFCACSAMRTINAAAAGQRYVAVFNGYSGGGALLVAAKKYEGSIGTDVKGFEDKTWAYTAEGGNTATLAGRVAEANGLDWDETDRLQIGNVAAFAPTLQAGRADIVSMDSGAAAQVLEAGLGYIVVNANEPDVQEELGFLIGTPLSAKPEFVEEYPELTQAIVNALLQSLLELRKASAEEALSGLTSEFKDSRSSETLWAAEWAIAQPALAAVDGSFTDRQLSDTMETAVDTDAVDASDESDYRGLFDNSYVEAAYKELGLTRPSLVGE